ncbi:F-box/RNI-like superfamily protein [Striga asiatica]|uniref:F-box/RNI-like superfamily protein n=1 Tax=Striga asiatica TaxID=4170 RepID=A0A5A7PSP5_STRAF|nr:F-box/RNI-like superfamily protein [Striga asiatica]
MADEFELPETIIHHIQSLLTPRQAGRTSILSKSWHAAWLTRPNLEFDQRDFTVGFFDPEKLSEFAMTFQRHVKSNLKIESLRLKLDCSGTREIVDPFGLTDEIIVKALRLGATRLDLCLTRRLTSAGDREHILPRQVLEAENHVGLAVAGYKIYDHLLDDQTSVRCSKLESLSLKDVQIKRDLFSCIASTCPLIKNLSLSNIWDPKPGVDSVCGRLTTNLPMLASLVLRDVKVDVLFLGDLSSKFPNLKDLTLQLHNFDKEMRISSCSLEHLSLNCRHHGNPQIVLDYVPRIQGLEGFQCRHQVEHLTVETGRHIPSLTSFAFFDGLFRICRPKLVTQHNLNNDFISKILQQGNQEKFSCPCNRPKMVTDQHPVSEFHNSNNDSFLSKILQQGTKRKFLCPCNFLYGLHDLEEVHVQPVDEVDAVWRLLTQESWSNIHPDKKQKVRFYLKWRPLPQCASEYVMRSYQVLLVFLTFLFSSLECE